MNKINNFSETEECKSRLQCLPCRSNNKFKEVMMNKYGLSEIVCPLNIPLGIKFSELPEEVKKIRENYMLKIKNTPSNTESITQAKTYTTQAATLMKQLKGKVKDNVEACELIDKIFVLTLNNYKNVENCSNGGELIGQVEQVCCGGTVKMVDQFKCSVDENTTDKKCKTCNKFCLKND